MIFLEIQAWCSSEGHLGTLEPSNDIEYIDIVNYHIINFCTLLSISLMLKIYHMSLLYFSAIPDLKGFELEDSISIVKLSLEFLIISSHIKAVYLVLSSPPKWWNFLNATSVEVKISVESFCHMFGWKWKCQIINHFFLFS